jgi:hypothetical protein
MNKLPPRVKKPFKSTYDQLIEMGMEKGIHIGEENKTKKLLHFWLHVKKYSISFIAEISGRPEEEIIVDIKKWNLELPAHE